MPPIALLLRLVLVSLVLAAWLLLYNLDAVLPAGTPLFARSLHALLGSFLWLGMAWLLVQGIVRGLIGGVLEGLLKRRVPGLVKDLLRALIYGAAIVGVLSVVLHLPVGGVLATTGAVGIVMGFALRDMIADFFSGIAINLEEPYRIGDTIGLESGFIGRVVEITWRTTRLISADEIASVVPNGRIGAMEVRNYSRPAQAWRAQTELILGHEVPVERSRRILEAALRGVDDGINRERGQAHVLNVDELGVHYLLYYWVSSIEEWSPLRTRVLHAALESLYHSGLSPVRPRSEVALRRAMGGQLGEEADRRLLLARVDLLRDLSELELARLATSLEPLSMAAGFRVVSEGEAGASLFIVREGLLDVRARDAAGVERTVASLRAGDLFGEFSLLTGDARSASVECVTECRLLEIRRADLEPILAERPELSASLADLLARRRLASRQDLERQGSSSHPHRELADRLLRRMREIFTSVPHQD